MAGLTTIVIVARTVSTRTSRQLLRCYGRGRALKIRQVNVCKRDNQLDSERK